MARTAAELNTAGFDELVVNYVEELKATGTAPEVKDIPKLKKSNGKPEEEEAEINHLSHLTNLREVGFTVTQLWNAADQKTDAGFTLHMEGFTLNCNSWELKKAGFTPQELWDAGLTKAYIKESMRSFCDVLGDKIACALDALPEDEEPGEAADGGDRQ